MEERQNSMATSAEVEQLKMGQEEVVKKLEALLAAHQVGKDKKEIPKKAVGERRGELIGQIGELVAVLEVCFLFHFI